MSVSNVNETGGPPRRTLLLSGAIAVIALIGGTVAALVGHNTGSAATASPTPVASATCPLPDTHPAWPKPADVIINERAANSLTTVHVGQTIEVALDASYRWRTGVPAPTNVQTQDPAGYFDSAHNTCVWRYTITQASDTYIPFERRMNCLKGQMCSDLIIYYRFAIHATA